MRDGACGGTITSRRGRDHFIYAQPVKELQEIDGMTPLSSAKSSGRLVEFRLELIDVHQFGMAIEEAFAWTAELSAGLFESDEAREGMDAFLQKRPAAWVPR